MQFYIVDVFAEQKYQGNPLAVLVPEQLPSVAEMQQVAREINFSETTFILSGKQKNGGYDVKIFTPDREIPFAGHPTLGTAYIIHQLIEDGASDRVLLNYPVGPIPVSIAADGLTMQQNRPEFGAVLSSRSMVADVLSIDEADIRTDYPIQEVSTGLPCVVVPLQSVDALTRCTVNHPAFQQFIDTTLKGNLLVFAPEAEGKLRVRVFMDDTGFREDPATGSANGNLAGYLLQHNFFNTNTIQYTVSQGREMNRPSLLRIKAALENGAFSIQVGGNVHLVAQGQWR